MLFLQGSLSHNASIVKELMEAKNAREKDTEDHQESLKFATHAYDVERGCCIGSGSEDADKRLKHYSDEEPFALRAKFSQHKPYAAVCADEKSVGRTCFSVEHC